MQTREIERRRPTKAQKSQAFHRLKSLKNFIGQKRSLASVSLSTVMERTPPKLSAPKQQQIYYISWFCGWQVWGRVPQGNSPIPCLIDGGYLAVFSWWLIWSEKSRMASITWIALWWRWLEGHPIHLRASPPSLPNSIVTLLTWWLKAPKDQVRSCWFS